MYQWFATTLVYYGLSLGAGDLGGSLLMTNFINGAVEVLCYILLPLFIDHPKIGRKYGTVWTMLLGSVGCLLTAVFDFLLIDDPDNDGLSTAKMICAVVGKFGVAGTFGIVYVHASEMYPTPVRGVGVGLSSAGGRIGGILAPIINGLGKTTSWLPFVIFGALGIVQVITVFFLPETLGVPMLTTIEEAEEFYANPDSFRNKSSDSQPTVETSSLSSAASVKKVDVEAEDEGVEF
ncbi:Oidioi.mRNA.OKI2018_I69.chr2.g4998.t1.cds [Oikopleura dioica]|uniref:Oidioi.mRNA.OKI2018_I69.chr2.g4998.t1.cds n=1 Tax=Oikopleura dioica TaxID=34765 RepID=A0ABN7T890_OIKDI|nr:Oidioi.mRNA.OKI2018_I69.chr2.g4998.t1.cds [Oikopleura dioica]